MKIEFNPWDLEITTIKNGDYKGTKKVNLKWQMSIDPDFIKEMIESGVREYVTEEEEEETN